MEKQIQKNDVPDTMERLKKDCIYCGNKLLILCVIGAHESKSGLTERLYQCAKCQAYWETYYNDKDKSEMIRKHYRR